MEAEKYHYVAIDLDGTLLDPEHKLPEENKLALQRLNEENVPVIIATGRSAGSVYYVAEALEFGKEVPLVCTNGARGKFMPSFGKSNVNHYANQDRPSKSAEIFHTPLSNSQVSKALKAAKKIGFCIQYYLGDEIYSNPVTDFDRAIVQKYQRMTSTIQHFVEDDFQSLLKKGLPEKLLVMCGEQNVETMGTHLRNELGSTCHIICGTPSFFVEILDKSANKGNGLKEMCEHLGYDLRKCIAFGDGNNDVEFLKVAGKMLRFNVNKLNQCEGKGIAMKNASKLAKQAADEISPWTNAEAGIARLIRKFREEGKIVPIGH